MSDGATGGDCVRKIWKDANCTTILPNAQLASYMGQTFAAVKSDAGAIATTVSFERRSLCYGSDFTKW